MSKNPNKVSVYGSIMTIFVLLTAEILKDALIIDERWYWCLLITIPAIVLIFLLSRNRQINPR